MQMSREAIERIFFHIIRYNEVYQEEILNLRQLILT